MDIEGMLTKLILLNY